MSVTTFDGTFSFRQDTLQRLGHREPNKLNDEQRAKFESSPFMQSVKRLNENAWERTVRRDATRKKTDPSFKPQDSDFSAAKAFDYNKNVNYYKVLGVDEFAPLEEVKKSYKKLSLIYHPDKTHGKSDEEKEEYAAIFIQIKNAYQTLGDNPTRRQYDKDRDGDLAGMEVNGWKVKEAPSFDAKEVMKRLQENAKPPGKLITVPITCKLEKFVYGGHKAVKRLRIARGGITQDKMYRIDIHPGSAEMVQCEFKQQGDWHEQTMTDSLKFQVSAKPHEVVTREGDHLKLRGQVPMPESMLEEPYFHVRAPSVKGRHILLWGRNPFAFVPGAKDASLHVKIHGQGVTSAGSFSFSCKAQKAGAAPPAGVPPQFSQASGAGPLVVCLTNLATQAQMYIHAEGEATTIGELQRQAAAILGLGRGNSFRLLKRLDGGRGCTPYPEKQQLGSIRAMSCAGFEWSKELPMNQHQAEAILQALVAAAKSRPLQECSEELVHLLPNYGYQPARRVLDEVIVRAMKQVPKIAMTEDLRVEVKRMLESSNSTSSSSGSSRRGERRFLKRFGLGPADATLSDSDSQQPAPPRQSTGGSLASDARVHPTMQRRVQAMQCRSRVCDLELHPLGKPIMLFTRPTCSISFVSTSTKPRPRKDGYVDALPALGVIIDCPACASKKAAKQWEALKAGLVPVLQASAFQILRLGQAIMPRCLDNSSAFLTYDGSDAESSETSYSAALWKRDADEAFRRGDIFTACNFYSRCLQESCDSGNVEEKSTVLSNRSACLAKMGHYVDALSDAQEALELQPRWARAWSRAGYASSMLKEASSLEEAIRFYAKAVELDPCPRHLEALASVASRRRNADLTAAHSEKEKANVAFRSSEFGFAIAAYTCALAVTPLQGADDESAIAFLRAVLLSDRSAAFAKLKKWDQAVADAELAVEAKGDFQKAHTRLGVAYLGAGQCECAYVEFAKAFAMSEAGNSKTSGNQTTLKGREAALAQLPLWRSVPARNRKERLYLDVKRPKGSSKVYAISDFHFDYKQMEDWVHAWDSVKFREDILIVAGNCCSTRGGLARGLMALKQKFRRVFYVPGDLELQIYWSEVTKFPDCLAKLLSIYELCDELGVDIFPAAVAEDMFIVPLMSWHDPEFDHADPYPDPRESEKSGCKWPIDPDRQLWKFMLKLNEANMNQLYHSTVISMSHFLPRRDLPFPKYNKAAKTSGCEDLDTQIRKIGSSMHVYGHVEHTHCQELDGVTYVNRFHGLNEDSKRDPALYCIHNGWRPEWKEEIPVKPGDW
mmetsp:Transcript_49142/g.117059  ORF Transcript_49142/g.117059 Transcript_49142/m.117059 type:complete len:1283 (+) Transcript_49142:149-3997(+)